MPTALPKLTEGTDGLILRRGLATRVARMLTEAPGEEGIEWRWRMEKKPGPERPGARRDRRNRGGQPQPWLDISPRGAVRYGSGLDPRCSTVTVPELSGWVLPGA
jgi:hypothetical protein